MRDAEGASPAGHVFDPGVATDLERALAALDDDAPDPRAGLFGPGSTVWEVNRETALFLGAGRALLMQLAHPAVAQAIVDHSPVRHAPVARFHRTFRPVYAMVFGSRAQAYGCARAVHRTHAAIGGTLPATDAHRAAGTAYRANDPEASRWVYATLAQSALVTRELVLPPLGDAAVDAYCDESRRFGALFGLGAEALPADRSGLDALVDAALDDGTLAVGAAGAELARFFLEREGGLLGRLVPRWYVALTAELLPAPLREVFGLRPDAADVAAAARTLDRVRRLYPRLPPRLRYVPPYHEALERLAGRRGPSLATRLGNRLWIGRSRLPGAIG